jgi:murein DD-endopeptidase MepM/ murein hydrolase activator NlpD
MERDGADTIRGEKGTPPETRDAGIPELLPVEGWISQPFNTDAARGGPPHLGIDIVATSGKQIKAPAEGTTIDVKEDLYYGKTIAIRHAGGIVTRYGHCAAIFVARGERVERGQAIGLVGNTGHSTAPHLHYEVILNGKNIDPMRFARETKQ